MILFSDFDNTLYFGDNDERTIANVEAIKKWREAGNQFCITTGRSCKSVIKQMPQMKDLCDYYIVDSGSIVLSKDSEMMNVFYFDPKIVEKIVELSKTFLEVPILVYYTPNSEDLEYEIDNVTKLRLWFKDTSLLHDVNEELTEKFPVFAVYNPDVEIKSSRSELKGYPGFVEVIPIESGKSSAIKALAQKEGIVSQEIVTIGDGLNDFGMVRDFNGFAIEESELSNVGKEIKTISSLAVLIEGILNNK